MSDFTRAKAQSPFVLEKSTDDEEELIYVKLMVVTATDTFKVSVPKLLFDKGSEHIMYCLDEFANIAAQYSFNNADNWLYFRQMLGSNERQQWDDIAPGLAHRTAAAYALQKRNFLLKHFTKKSYQYFLDYIRVVHKPAALGARKLQNRITTLFRYASYLPNGNPIDGREQCRLYVHMFPDDQRDDLERVKDDPFALELPEIAEFFATYERPDAKPSAASGKRIRGGDFNSKRKDRNNNKKIKFNRFKQNEKSRNGNKDKDKNDKSNMCRHHAHLGDRNHKWKDCIFNANGPNYRPNARPPSADGKQQPNAPIGPTGSYMSQYPMLYPPQMAYSYHSQGTPFPYCATPQSIGAPPPPTGSFYGQMPSIPAPPSTPNPYDAASSAYFQQKRN